MTKQSPSSVGNGPGRSSVATRASPERIHCIQGTWDWSNRTGPRPQRVPSVLLQLSRWDVAQCKSNDPLEPCPMEPWEGSLSQTGSKSHSRARFQKQGFFSALETHLPPHPPPGFTSYLCFTAHFFVSFFSDFNLQTLFGGEEADVKDWTNWFDPEFPRLHTKWPIV